jgi:hypothetical protein
MNNLFSMPLGLNIRQDGEWRPDADPAYDRLDIVKYNKAWWAAGSKPKPDRTPGTDAAWTKWISAPLVKTCPLITESGPWTAEDDMVLRVILQGGGGGAGGCVTFDTLASLATSGGNSGGIVDLILSVKRGDILHFGIGSGGRGGDGSASEESGGATTLAMPDGTVYTAAGGLGSHPLNVNGGGVANYAHAQITRHQGDRGVVPGQAATVQYVRFRDAWTRTLAGGGASSPRHGGGGAAASPAGANNIYNGGNAVGYGGGGGGCRIHHVTGSATGGDGFQGCAEIIRIA